MDSKRVSIIVLNWNNYKDTRECLESLSSITYPNYEVIVVDNGSIDGSTKKVEDEFLQNEYIYNEENLGFTGGINVGIRRAFDRGADYIFFINNDMIVDKGFLEPLVAAMSDEQVGLVGPATYCYPQTEKLYTAGRKVSFWRGNTKEIERIGAKTEVQCLGGCFLIKRSVIEKIGCFFEPYYLIFEEIDYCMQARRHGFKIFCEPKSVIWHKVRQTLDKMPVSESYYSYRNKFLFVKRNAPMHIRIMFYFYCSFYVLLRSAADWLRGQKNKSYSMLEALLDFWTGNFGRKQGVLSDKIFSLPRKLFYKQ